MTVKDKIIALCLKDQTVYPLRLFGDAKDDAVQGAIVTKRLAGNQIFTM